MPKPIANAKPFTGDLIGEYLVALQAGVATDNPGLDQMTKLKLSVLRDYIIAGVAPALHPVHQSGSTLPENPANGDYFFADTTFTVGGKTYTQGHMYTWDGVEWEDTSDIFSQYASQAQVDDLQLKVDAIDGLDFKGSITEAELEEIEPSAENKGWMYYVSDLGVYKASDGTDWVTVIDYVTQTIESGNTTKAPSSDAVYQMKTQLKADLEAQISANSKRITNLEQKAGTEFDVTYPSTTYGRDGVPANVAKYAKGKTLIGVTRAKNQLCAGVISTVTENGVTFTKNSDGSLTLSGTANALISEYVITEMIVFKATDRHFIGGLVARSGVSYGVRGFTVNNDSDFFFVTTNGWTHGLAIRITSGTNVDGITLHPIVTSLTKYFSSDSSVDVSTLTISDIQSKYPELLIPSDYDAGSLDSTTYSGIESTGLNIWNEQYEVGFIDTSTGANTSANDALRSKDMIPVNAGETLYCYAPNCETSAKRIRIYFYGYDGSFINSASMDNLHTGNGYGSGQFDIPSGCAYIRFTTANQSTPVTYNHDIQFVDNSLSTAIKQTHHDYMHDEIALSESVKLSATRHEKDTLNVETGDIDRRTGEKTFDSDVLNWTFVPNGSNCYQYTATELNFGYKLKASWGQICLDADKLTPVAQATIYNNALTKSIAIGDNGNIHISNDVYADRSLLIGVTVVVQRDVPITEHIDPVLDPFIEVEGGGTLKPIQSQATEIDSSMTAEYLAIGA